MEISIIKKRFTGTFEQGDEYVFNFNLYRSREYSVARFAFLNKDKPKRVRMYIDAVNELNVISTLNVVDSVNCLHLVARSEEHLIELLSNDLKIEITMRGEND